MNTNAANFAGTQLAGCRCGWLLTYTAALSKDSRHHAASTSTGFASDFRRTRRHPNQPRNFSALRRYVGRIRSSLQSRCQPIHKLLRPAAFVQRTGKTTSAGLRSVRLRGKRSRLWWRWEDSNLRAPCAPVPLTHGCSCRELQNAITTLPHLHEGGCRSFPAVTAACRLLAVSPDRYTFLLPSCALSPEARSACTSHEHWIWCRRLDSNQRHTSWRGALPTELRLHEGGCSSFRAASQSCDGAQALLRQQSFKRSQTHLLEGELKGLAFGHVSMCPQLQHRGLRGLLQDFASPKRLSR